MTQETAGDGITVSGSADEAPAEALCLVQDGKSVYCVVYPEGADKELMAAVNRLISAFSGATGVTLPRTDDFLPTGATAGEYEILVGRTERSESRQIAAELRQGEYAVTAVGNRLVLCGADTAATVAAVDRFIDRLTPAADGVLLFRAEDACRKTGSFYVDSLRIAGVSMGEYRIVVPREGYAEYEVAVLLRQYLQAYTGFLPQVVTDEKAESAHEIHIGLTDSFAGEYPEDGTYTVTVRDGNVFAAASSDMGYLELLAALKSRIFPNTQSVLELSEGACWSGADNTPEEPVCAGSLRVMYHNTWGYLNADGSNPMANRASLALTVYRRYLPDVLCLEEAGPNWRNAASALLEWLAEAGYGEICFSALGGAGNPIFYNTATLELTESGYSRSRSGDKGTTWAVFRERANGRTFAVTNSHFAADTNAGGDPGLGNTYRAQDATVVVSVVAAILERYGEICVISGGDFNCMAGSDPYAVLTDAGFVNVRETAEQTSDRSAYHGSFPYHAELGIYALQAVLPYDGAFAIDHIMTCGAAASVRCYAIASDPIALTTSDHAPHYIDLTLQE